MTSQVQQPLQAPQIVSWCHPIGTRDGTLAKDAKMVNCFLEQTENGMALVKRPGLAMVLQQQGSAAQGGFVCDSYAYYVTNDTIYAIDGGFSLTIPNVGLPNDQYYFLSDTPTGKTIFKNSKGMWVFTSHGPHTVGGTLAQVTDVNYPLTTSPGVAYLDGIVYVMDLNGSVRGSAIDDPTTWPALNFIAADLTFGAGLQITRHLNFLIAYYSNGIQFYYDANAANGVVTQGTQLGPVTNASWTTGIAAGETAVEMLDMQFFLARDRKKGVLVGQFNGVELTIISTPYVEKILSRSNMVNPKAFGLRINGHSFYGITLFDIGLTLVYDVAANQWQQWTSVVNGIEQYFVGDNYVHGEDMDLLQNILDGSVMKMDPTVYTDVTGPINVTAVTPIYDYGTINWKRVATMAFLGDTVNTSIAISHSDDDYTTWSTPRTVDMSTVRKTLQRGGRFRRRAFKMFHADNTPLRLVDARFDLTVLNS